ncbi:ClpP/crotonase [Fomitiporia mediterranea MF3/22]|uniref:ClpP/crotonase n=1 Tax=Fomitiporia mediterranea (strain MF3/22) TaxID=694068 RepID=UPI0004407EC8|nr:ClpP/crotonase [Fomitiporia mediterranea MF3/22]EJD04628.1 ClpP/crotonase [Fomitiporia mediterranea MF3/22]
MTDYTYETSPSIKVSSPFQHVLLVELQRLWTELGQVFDKIDKDGAVRAVVLASAFSKIFTAGLDLTDAGSITSDADTDPARKALRQRDHLLKFQSAISAIEHCRVPVILAAHGLVLGLGVDIACACDVRYASEDTQFCIKEVDVGLAADIGTLARLPKIAANFSLTSELAYTARPFGPSEAQALGFISRVVPGGRDEVIKAAVETASKIAEKSPVAVAGTKRFLLHARDHSVADALEYQATWNAFALQASDLKDSFAAFKTKNKPEFKNLPKL